MNTQLVTQLQAIFGNIGPEIEPLLAVYVSGDHLKGRPLWNSPVELAIVVDADEPPRFPPREVVLLPEAELDRIKKALSGLDYRFNFRLARLAQRRGTIALYQERYTAFLHYYHMLQAVVNGVRLYHAEDFVLEDFERDLRLEWETNDTNRHTAAQEVLKQAFSEAKLPPVETIQLKRLDEIYVAELLKQLREALATSQEMRETSLDQFANNYNVRSRVRYSWRQISTATAELARHVISRQTRHTPHNYTQLLTYIADLGIVDYKQVDGLCAICEHPMLMPVQRQISQEDVEVFYLMTEHITSADAFSAGLTRYLHQLVL